MISRRRRGTRRRGRRRPARRRGRDAVQRVVPDRRRRCARAVAPDAALVVTDKNRDRARIWSSVLDNVGYTEQAGEKPLVADPSDARLPLFPGEPADALTTTQQRGVKTVAGERRTATRSRYTPEDRAARALDGDPTTAWRAAALGNARRPVHPPRSSTAPITTDHVNLVQPLNGGRNRWITKVELIFDGHTTVLGRARRVVAHGRRPDDHVRPAALLDARDPDHRRERPPPQAVRRAPTPSASPRSACATSTPTTTCASTRSSRCRRTSSTRSARAARRTRSCS